MEKEIKIAGKIICCFCCHLPSLKNFYDPILILSGSTINLRNDFKMLRVMEWKYIHYEGHLQIALTIDWCLH